jgi:hypothetical protein
MQQQTPIQWKAPDAKTQTTLNSVSYICLNPNCGFKSNHLLQTCSQCGWTESLVPESEWKRRQMMGGLIFTAIGAVLILIVAFIVIMASVLTYWAVWAILFILSAIGVIFIVGGGRSLTTHSTRAELA